MLGFRVSAWPSGQREARQSFSPQFVRVGHAIRGKNHEPLTEFFYQLTIVRETRKEFARFEDRQSTVKCKNNCREGFWITMT
jgi:hypothetical protein